MRLILLPIVLLASLVATAPPDQAGAPQSRNCEQRIQQVRDVSSQPALNKIPAVPGQGFFIAAVDKRVDGCPVMQMQNNINDLRPLPEPPEGPARLQPAL